jgi:hypothetical protein
MRKKQFITLGPLIFISCLFLSGCVTEDNQRTPLNPARDLTGTWTGTPVFTDRANECAYEGTMELTLRQNQNHLTGSFNLTVTKTTGDPPCVRVGSLFSYLVDGTVSSSRIHLIIADTDYLNGSFTTDLMTLRWQQCTSCRSGPAIKLIGMVSLMREQ